MTPRLTGRRAFLRALAGVGALGAAGTAGAAGGAGDGAGRHSRSPVASGGDADDPDGTVTTRGHYDIGWFNNVYRDPDVGEYEYEVESGVPGYDADEASPEELVVFAHGWLINDWTADANLATLAGTLGVNDYTHPVVGFEYDADEAVAVDDWFPGVEIARRNGKKLAAFLADYRDRNPGTPLRVVGHSLGCELVLSTLSHLGDDAVDFSGTVERVTLLGAAVPDGAVAEGGDYHGALDRAVAIDNFHSPYDDILKTGYGTIELDEALGNVGADGPTPAHYEDHEVPEATNHFDYFIAGSGCIDRVVAQWAADPSSPPEDPDTGDPWTRTGTVTEDGLARHTYPAGGRACTVSLSGADGTDFDLYVTRDGSPAGPEEYDERSWTYGSDESVTLDDPGSEVGIAVHSYDGAGEYELRARPAD